MTGKKSPKRGTFRWLLWVGVSYLLGSVPFSYLVVRWLTGLDVRSFGSGNPGATNALRVGGAKAGAASLLGDLGKGVAATALPRALGAPPAVSAASAVAVTAGHVYPAFLGLKGGKGTATGFGALVTLAPVAATGSLALFSATVAKTRYVSLGSVVAAGSFPLLVAAGARRRRDGGVEVLSAAAAITAMIINRHRGNLRRLRSGEERKLGAARQTMSGRQSSNGDGQEGKEVVRYSEASGAGAMRGDGELGDGGRRNGERGDGA